MGPAGTAEPVRRPGIENQGIHHFGVVMGVAKGTLAGHVHRLQEPRARRQCPQPSQIGDRHVAMDLDGRGPYRRRQIGDSPGVEQMGDQDGFAGLRKAPNDVAGRPFPIPSSA